MKKFASLTSSGITITQATGAASAPDYLPQIQIINYIIINGADALISTAAEDAEHQQDHGVLAWDDVYFNGFIKDVRVYNRALSSTEIQQNYNGDVTTNGLVSWWKMNERGKIIYDSIGENDETVHEARWANYSTHKYTKPGTYKVQLTVLNEDGQDHTITQNITIK